MVVPKELLESLQHVSGFDQKAFEEVHASGRQVTSVRVNPAKLAKVNDVWSTKNFFQQAAIDTEKIPWTSFGFYLSERPSFTFDPLFHAGCYYVQEASSMFVEQALRQTVNLTQPLKVLDLCAAPGGKSTHLQSLISAESLLVSNEVIKGRAGILKQNIVKWGCENVVVTNNDPQHFAKLEGFFDVLVIDAPCSGSGLFRKDEEAINEWSKDNVLLCCGRQKRIITDAFAALKDNGILIYSTCSYSKEEDEDIANWLVQELEMKNEKLVIDDTWGIVETQSSESGAYGYRFFPDKVKGEGFYLTCFRKATAANAGRTKQMKLEKASAKEKSIVERWLQQTETVLLKDRLLFALPSFLIDDYSLLKTVLNIQYAGVAVGEIMKEKLIPDHALAQSALISDLVPRVDLELKDAIRYLQKQEIQIETAEKGWQLVSYQQHNLGWINALQNRVNNYYPKELRILKQTGDAFGK